jgi:hypothetical protein
VWTTTACVGDPAAPQAPENTSETTVPKLEGSYELRDPVDLQMGGQLSLVQVHFDRGERADGHTYLAQVATRTGQTASTLLLQQTYARSGDSISFAGGLLEPGAITGSDLRTTVDLNGERIRVVLRRKILSIP